MNHLNIVKCIQLIMISVIITLNGTGQDTSKQKLKEPEITIGTFYTLNETNKHTVNPFVAGNLGDYTFENRYNYEAVGTSSVNAGKRILKKSKHIEITPMGGVIFGRFKGVSAEIRTSLKFSKWAFSTDMQFSFAYSSCRKNIFLNLTIARYKLTSTFSIGAATLLGRQVNQNIVLDKGVTAALSFKKWSIWFYAFNFEKKKRYYWLSVFYNIKVKQNGK